MMYSIDIDITPYLCRGDTWPQNINIKMKCSEETKNKIMKIIKEEMPEYFGDEKDVQSN